MRLERVHLPCKSNIMCYIFKDDTAGRQDRLQGAIGIDRHGKKYAIEIKRSLAPTVSKGFYLGCEDIGATQRFIVYPGKERFPTSENTTVMPLADMMNELLGLKNN